MLDIIGIGSLNVDLTITAEKMETLAPDIISEANNRLKNAEGRPVDISEVSDILSLLGHDSFKASLGGSAFNAIHAIAALKKSIKIGYVGVSGYSDNSALNFKKYMQKLSIDNRYVDLSSDERNGICVCVNRKGGRNFLYYPGCNNKMAEYVKKNYDDILAYLTEARILHITSFSDDITPGVLAKIIKDVREKNPLIKISCDPGYAWLKYLTNDVADILKISDFIFVNQVEYNLLSGKMAKKSDLEKARKIFSKCGLQGSVLIVKKQSEIKLFSQYDKKITAKGFKIKVINDDKINDFTGAGDAFAAGFLAAQIVEEAAMPKAVELGIQLMRAKLSISSEKLYPELAKVFSKYQKKIDNI